jgi:hypothetical protein
MIRARYLIESSRELSGSGSKSSGEMLEKLKMYNACEYIALNQAHIKQGEETSRNADQPLPDWSQYKQNGALLSSTVVEYPKPPGLQHSSLCQQIQVSVPSPSKSLIPAAAGESHQGPI